MNPGAGPERRYRLMLRGALPIETAYLDSEDPAERGSGKPGEQAKTILLIHGLFANRSTWRYLWPCLERQFRLVAPDLVGFGNSSKPSLSGFPVNYRYSPAMLSDCLYEFIEGCRLDNLYLCGNSLGGGVALHLLLNHDLRERVRGLVLSNSAGYPQVLPGYLTQLAGWPGALLDTAPLRWAALRTDLVARVVRGGLERAQFDGRRSAAELAPDYVLPLGERNGIFACRMAAKNLLPANHEEMVARLPQLSFPTLLIWGHQDPIIPFEFATRFERDLSMAQRDPRGVRPLTAA